MGSGAVRLAVLGVLMGLAIAPAAAQADVSWLCRPGLSDSPCAGDQTTTYFASDGTSTVSRPDVPADPPIDCFYVYPTVSNQPTPNATATPDPEVRSIASYQAQRFSTRCRIFAPLYRQVTAVGVTVAGQTHDTSGYSTAYADVREAWQQYLRDDNRGRGFVLVGHSQGSRILRALIRREIDPNPAVRARLVSAIIPGANATVRDFAHVPPCADGGQTGCVISYSTFNAPPPDNARFGRTDTDPVGTALDLPAGPGLEVLCTDPAALAGTDGRLDSLLPSQPFAPGVIAALLLRLYGGPPPTADTPWLQPADHYTGRCETSNGAHVLMLAPVGNARTLTPSPDDTWGIHLVDLNIALGNLTTIVGAETKTWVGEAHPPSAGGAFAVSLTARRARARARRLTAGVTGPPGSAVRVFLRRGAGTVVRRAARLDEHGRARARFTVHRAGRYRVLVTAGGRRVAVSKSVRLRTRPGRIRT